MANWSGTQTSKEGKEGWWSQSTGHQRLLPAVFAAAGDFFAVPEQLQIHLGEKGGEQHMQPGGAEAAVLSAVQAAEEVHKMLQAGGD